MNYLEAWQKYENLSYEDLPENVRRVAHQCVLDWFGCALAGSREPLSGILRDEFSHRNGNCQVLGSNLSLEPATAALVNGASGHALDFDDTNARVMCHATAPLFPAVLAMAEEIGASGAQLITAFVVGVEIEGRIGNAIGPQHYRKGWHATGTFGTFGAAAGVAHLLKLDQQAYATAMALAASAASGIKANFGTMTKPYHAGQAAERGLIAARLAARGFTANPDAINGNQGYIQAAGVGEIDQPKLKSLADKWMILDSLFKFHAACHLTHASIESILQLRDKLDASSIQSTKLCVHPDLLDVCGIEAPRTGLEGKFSLRANAALAWLGLDTSDPETYVDEVICRDDVQTALQRVSVDTSTQMNGMQTSVICVDHDQETHEASWDTGVPCKDLNLQENRLKRKFDRLSAPILGSSNGLGDLLLHLGEQSSLEALWA